MQLMPPMTSSMAEPGLMSARPRNTNFSIAAIMSENKEEEDVEALSEESIHDDDGTLLRPVPRHPIPQEGAWELSDAADVVRVEQPWLPARRGHPPFDRACAEKERGGEWYAFRALGMPYWEAHRVHRTASRSAGEKVRRAAWEQESA